MRGPGQYVCQPVLLVEGMSELQQLSSQISEGTGQFGCLPLLEVSNRVAVDKSHGFFFFFFTPRFYQRI